MNMRYFILSFLIMLTSCGYGMRGNIDIPSTINEVSISSGSYSEMVIALNLTLQNNRINITSSNKKDIYRIIVLSETFNRRQLTLSAAGRVNEYELIYEISYELSPPNKKSAADKITLYRDYSFNENNVMGNSDREDYIRKEMVSTASTLIFNKLKAMSTANN